MPTTLCFRIQGLKTIVEHSQANPEFAPGFAHLTDPEYLKAGERIGESGYARPDQVDAAKIPPHFCLVHDHGLYLMAGTTKTLRDPSGANRSLVVYAQGMDPQRDSDWWEQARDAVGG